MIESHFFNKFIHWAQAEPSIHALILIGSRVHSDGSIGSADNMSDWDFQIITSRHDLFLSPEWTHAAGLAAPLAYVSRAGRLGKVTKISAVFHEAEVDLVLLPVLHMRVLKLLAAVGFAKQVPSARAALVDLALVIKSGFHIVKGRQHWHGFFENIAANIATPRLSDEAICNMANGYVCDWISTRHKIRRGELLAAQRWLHWQLAEANFRLMHELRLRLGEATYPDARRIEIIASDCWKKTITVSTQCESRALLDAVDHSSKACRILVDALVGSKWQWPDLPERLS